MNSKTFGIRDDTTNKRNLRTERTWVSNWSELHYFFNKIKGYENYYSII